MSVENQIILESHCGGSVIESYFDTPLCFYRQQIALKTIHHGKFTYGNDRLFTFTVRDRSRTHHQLKLRQMYYNNSAQMVHQMHVSLVKLFQVLKYDELGFKEPSVIDKSDVVTLKYDGSGLMVTSKNDIPIEGRIGDDIFSIIDLTKLERYSAEGISILKHDFTTADVDDTLAYLYCNIISYSQVNNRKKQVLAVLKMKNEDETCYLEDVNPVFHRVIFENVMHIQCHFETLNGAKIQFTNEPIVIVLKIK